MPQAATAITILEQLMDKVGAAHMAYWVTPNAILTLAGVRGYCDGVFWGPAQFVDQWQREIDTDIKELQKLTTVYMASSGVEEASPTERHATYDLILRDGLDYVLAQTSLARLDPDSLAQRTPEAFMETLSRTMAQQSGKTYSAEDFGHAAFGVIVGYPDAAITGMIEAVDPSVDPFAEPVIEADIRGATYYVCPQPIYEYPRHLATDPTIQAHEQLWSTILKDFYTSDFHQKLVQDPAFQAKLTALDIR